MYSTEVLDYWDLDYRIPHNTWSYKILHLFYIFNIIRNFLDLVVPIIKEPLYSHHPFAKLHPVKAIKQLYVYTTF